jgi:AcrR family transcriptional regulator
MAHMHGKGKQVWLERGYDAFAIAGKGALKIETLAQQVGISKSSFYHHFADLDVFMEQLLALHLERASALATKERNAQSIDPELIDILVAHKTDLLFSRQLKVHRDEPGYQLVLQQTQQLIGSDFVKLWARELQWKGPMPQLEVLFSLALENFYLQISAETLEPQWLRDYFSQLTSMIRVFQ